MKYLINILLLTGVSFSCLAQTMQASIGIGSSAKRIMIYIKPDVPVNGNISTLQYNVAVPASISPAPVISIVGVPPIGTGWIVQPSYVEDGYRHYEILTASVFNINIGAVETPAMEVEFNGGPLGVSDVSLVTLPFAGVTTGNALFLCTGAANSNSAGAGLYYTRPGTTVVNNDSYNGGPTSFATVTGIVLPVKWISFNAVKSGNDVLLNWAVVNEDDNHHYELQRSNNGTDFATVAVVNKTANNGGSYNYTDAGIESFGASILYYRVMQVESSGNFSYSEIRHLIIDKKGPEITIFPNPVWKGFYVNVPLTGPGTEKVKLNLFGTNGQIAISKEITAAQASNYYFDITGKKLAAGQYNLQVIMNEKTIASKMLTIKQ